jgi:hypothetical protein
MLRFQSPILRCSFGRNRLASLAILILPVLYSTRNAFNLETLTLALPAKSFQQQIIYPLAQERGYMKEEGIDLKITFMEPPPTIQAMVSGLQLRVGCGSTIQQNRLETLTWTAADLHDSRFRKQ